MYKFGLFLLIITGLTFAQEEAKFEKTGGYARVFSLGDNPYILDADNLKTNPAFAGMYSNFLWGDLGSAAVTADDGVGQFAAFNLKVTKDFTVGAILARKDFMTASISQLDPWGVVTMVNTTAGGGVVTDLDNNFEILGSYMMNNWSFGLGIAYASTAMSNTPAGGVKAEGSASQIGFNLGAVGKLSSGFDLDVDLSLMMPGASYEAGGGAPKIEASSTFMMLNARAFYKGSSKFTYVPVVSFATASGSKTNAAGVSSDLPSSTHLQVGFGIHYQMGDFLLAGGPSFMWMSTTTPSTTANPELSNSSVEFPGWNLGVEWALTDWLTGRVGYVANTASFTNENTATATTKNESTGTMHANDLRVGFGFKFGKFQLHATVAEQILRDGFKNISGGSATFGYISGHYEF